MPEGMNTEVAHHLAHGEHDTRGSRRLELLEIGEVVLLAIVAIATAWSGYQAARWDGRQSLLYGQASRDRFEADAANTRGGQFLIGDWSLFTAWLQAHQAGDAQLTAMLERRFTPDYQIAFRAWLNENPFTSHKAPPGPSYMPEYHNPYFARSDRLNTEASATFSEGGDARENAEKYVRDTVLFATVLFLVAMAQRFKVRAARLGANAVAAVLLAFTLVSVVLLPRA